MGETDRRLTVFSRRLGKLIVIAKGVRKINSRRAPYLDLFSHLTLFLSRGRTFDIITDVAPLNVFSKIRENLPSIAVAFHMAELTDRLLPERFPQLQIFSRLLHDLIILNSVKNAQLKALCDNYGLFLLWELGYLPPATVLTGSKLDRFLEEVMEKKIESSRLLTKLS